VRDVRAELAAGRAARTAEHHFQRERLIEMAEEATP
jgi:hypothetical protein